MYTMSFLSEQGIITTTTSGGFQVDHGIAGLIRAELKCMPRFPQHFEAMLLLFYATLPLDFESSDTVGLGSSYSKLALSLIGALTELCHEDQLSKSSLDVSLLMTIRTTRLLSNTGLHVKAKEIIQRILDWASNTLSFEIMASSMLRRQLAFAVRHQGHLEAAERIESEVLWLHENHLGKSHVETIRSLNNYALALQDGHKLTDSERCHLKALSMKERKFGPDHADSLISVHNLGECRQALGQHISAEKLFYRALSGRQLLFMPDHPAVLRSMNSLGVSYYFQGRYKEAERMLHDCLSSRRKLFGDQHLETMRSKGNLALAYCSLGKISEAEVLLRNVIIAFHEMLGPDQPETIQWHQNLARLLRDRFRYREAERILRGCLPRVERTLGRLYFRSVAICRELAIVLHEQEKYSDALGFAHRVRDARIELFGYDNSETRNSIQHVEQLVSLL
jgi:hypothetical protein